MFTDNCFAFDKTADQLEWDDFTHQTSFSSLCLDGNYKEGNIKEMVDSILSKEGNSNKKTLTEFEIPYETGNEGDGKVEVIGSSSPPEFVVISEIDI